MKLQKFQKGNTFHKAPQLKQKRFSNQSSVIGKTAMIATHGKRHFCLTKARLCVLASLSGIPSFDPEQVEWLSTFF